MIGDTIDPKRLAGRLLKQVEGWDVELLGPGGPLDREGGDLPVVRLQRVRILGAAVDVVAERGFAGASVSAVCVRAGVSRRTLYELFENLEGCFLAILDLGMKLMARAMAQAFAREEYWLDALVHAEAAVLTFLDDEPRLARVLLVEALGAGSRALERRAHNVAVLRELIVERFSDTPLMSDSPPLASRAVMASLLGIMHEHLVCGDDAPFISLLGPLMGVITVPYLDAESVAREVRRGELLARQIQASRASESDCPAVEKRAGGIGGVGVPALLRNSRASRARMCVVHLAECEKRQAAPSNKEIATAIGVFNKGQMSKLLARLETAGILRRTRHGPGKPNAWTLTAYGRGLAAWIVAAEGG